MVEGFSIPNKRSDRVVLEANLNYWDKYRFPRLKRIVFDNTLKAWKTGLVPIVQIGLQNDPIVKLNWEENMRLKQPFRIGSFINFKPGSRLDIIDPYTVRFVFPEPDGGALAKITMIHMGNRQFYRDFGWGEKSW